MGTVFEALATAGAAALVGAMATDAWQQARQAVVELWRRVHPDRAVAVEGELAEVRSEVLAARTAGETSVEAELAADWQRRLRRLLQGDPSVAGELRRVLEEQLTPLLSEQEQARVGAIIQHATASGNARVYQAGRDQHISER